MNIENPYDPAKFSKYLKDRYFNVKDNTLEESNIDLKEHIENEVLDFIDKHPLFILAVLSLGLCLITNQWGIHIVRKGVTKALTDVLILR